MNDYSSRTRALIGEGGYAALAAAHVCLIGIGGVGGHAAESLVRCGVGKITFIDGDVIEITNLNRQLIATVDTIGQKKAEVMLKRALSIRPNGDFCAIPAFYAQESGILPQCDFVIDAIDRKGDKIALIEECLDRNIAIISCMGAGNRLDPSAFRVTDVYATAGDPFAKALRKELRTRGVAKLPVVCSEELPRDSALGATPASISFTPAAAGLLLASYVVRRIMGEIT